MIYRTPEKVVSFFPDSGKSVIPAPAACADGGEKLFMMFRQLVPIPPLGLLQCPPPVLCLEFRISAKAFDSLGVTESA
jgi:hypothetical protein